MKVLILFLSIILTTNVLQIQGRYQMIYEEDYSSQNGIILIKGKSYKRVLEDGTIVRGEISYSNSSIVLRDKNVDFQVELYVDEIDKDTVHFLTRKSTEISEDGDIKIYSGKMIKLK